MTDYEWPRVVEVLAGLWPKAFGRMTDEEAATWRRVSDPYRPDEVIRELRGLAETMKFTPRPCELRARLRRARERDHSTVDQRVVNAGDLDRQAVAMAMPRRAAQAERSSDQEAAALRVTIDYRYTRRVYGEGSPSTQAARRRAEHLREHVPEGWWAE